MLKKIICLALSVCTVFALVAMTPLTASAATVQKGSSGSHVKKVENNLYFLGYDVGKIDSKADAKLVAAIKSFQKDEGLYKSGICDKKTQNRLKACVRTIQQDLTILGFSCTADGVAGTATTKAMKSFQKAYKLSATGRADSNTLKTIANNIVTISFNHPNVCIHPVRVKKGTSYTIPYLSSADTATSAGVFCGWSTSKKANQATYISGNKITVNKNTTLYAVHANSRYEGTESRVVEYAESADGNTQLSRYFFVKEFACKARDQETEVLIDNRLVALLSDIRANFGKAVTINSAYRTVSHNRSVKGASNSNHLYGLAADIRVSGVTPLAVAQYAEELGINGIGLYSNFVHLDTRDETKYWKTDKQISVRTFL